MVFLSHALLAEFVLILLLFHELPPLNIPVHLIHPSGLDSSLLLEFLLFSEIPIVICVILVCPVDGPRKVRRLWVGFVNLSVVHKLVVASNVLPCSKLVEEVFFILHCLALHLQLTLRKETLRKGGKETLTR